MKKWQNSQLPLNYNEFFRANDSYDHKIEVFEEEQIELELIKNGNPIVAQIAVE